jgi:hypothetical protein
MGRSREEKKNEWVTHTNKKILLREREREREREMCQKGGNLSRWRQEQKSPAPIADGHQEKS